MTNFGWCIHDSDAVGPARVVARGRFQTSAKTVFVKRYMEFRDNRVVFFVDRLARGKHSVAYRMRAEIPGRFSALPTKGWAMYAPELKANSDEIKLQVRD